MLKYIEGNIFDSPAQVIVNTVNTVGVMGKGLALQYKQRYPEMFKIYQAACEKHQLTTGKLMLWHGADHWVLLFPTKENWRYPSRLEYIEKGLEKFVKTYAEKQIHSIAFPRLGCGNGELDWADVKPLMEKYLEVLPIDVYIYLNPILSIEPEHKKIKATMDWMKTYAKDLSFNGVKDDIICSTTLMPHTFKAESANYSVKWEDGLVFIKENIADIFRVSETSFFEIWDEIRMKGVFETPAADKTRILIYAMLFSFGYLTEIRIMDEKDTSMVAGYQANEGSGRVFSLKGIA